MIGITIRKATLDDISAIKDLADAHKYELGFMIRSALVRSVGRQEVFVAEDSTDIVGFVEYHHRKDRQTTLYHIAVRVNYRRKGVGRLLITTLVAEAREREKKSIQLKCPLDLAANRFYYRMGFSRIGIELGERRRLAVWELPVS